MVEEQKEQKKESTDGSIDAGDKPKTPDLIDQANFAAERMEAANKKREEILKREEDLEARRRLGGQTEGAAQEETKPKDEDPVEYANKVLRGEIKPTE
jgi:hypothetical protein